MMRSLKDFLRRADGAGAEFDAVFYGLENPDLAHLIAPGRLRKHYIEHGRGEGRQPSLASARMQYHSIDKIAPKDFKVAAYRALNPDLRTVLATDWQYEQHYLDFGFMEGRSYKSDFDDDRTWKALFHFGDFLLYSQSWRDRALVDRTDAIRLFSEEGVKRLTPLAKGYTFDPDFYRQQYGVELGNSEELYRDWLERGLDLDLAPNEPQAIYPFLRGKPYPSCLDWRSIGGFARRSAVYPVKIERLRRLFKEPPGWHRRHVVGPGAATLFKDIGDYHRRAGADALALEAYDLSIEMGGDTATHYHHRGDVRRNLRQLPGAVADYRKAMTFPAHSVQVVHNAATLMQAGRIAMPPASDECPPMSSVGSIANECDGVAAILGAAYAKWAGHVVYRRSVDEYIDNSFRETRAATMALVREERLDQANDVADRDLASLGALIARLKLLGRRRIELVGRRVAMLANLDLQQRTYQRVWQKQEQLALHGFDLAVTDLKDPAAFMRTLAGASAAIFYRVPARPKIIEAVLYARALGIPTYYDIDEPIFTREFPDTFVSHAEQISRDEVRQLRHDASYYRNAIALCDYGLAPTRTLADMLEPLVRLNVAYTIPNALGSRDENAIRIGTLARPFRDEVTIFHDSGTGAHDQDFTELVGPALPSLFRRFPKLRLTLVGSLALQHELQAFGDRIDSYPPVDDLEKHRALLSISDINLAVVGKSRVAHCESEVKWLEAAVLGIPTVLSPTATYRHLLDPPTDALFAARTDEWESSLSCLIGDPVRRRSIGEAARAKALRDYASGTAGRLLLEALKLRHANGAAPSQTPTAGRGTIVTSRSSPAPIAGARQKILVCNVFFAPQTYGGATQVVENNIDYLLDNHRGEFEIAVLATDEGAAAGEFRVDSYRDRPVFRIGTPAGRKSDWRAFDEDHVGHVEHVFDVFQPDLVHFHCIQRLTASVVECALKRAIPYLVTVHDGWWISDHQFLIDQGGMPVDVTHSDPFATRPQGVSHLESVERRQRLRGLLQQAEATLAVSEPFEAIYRSAGLTNTRTVANGVPPLPPPMLSSTPDNKLVLGHIGGRSTQKGSNLIEIAMTQVAFANLEVLMIDHDIEYGSEVMLQWGSTVVTLRGRHPQAAIAQLFASFDVLLAPSIWPESYGLVTREAEFYGKWIIASDRGGIGTDIQEGRTGFRIDVSKTDDLVRVLSMMNDDPHRFKTRPVRDKPLRSADDQARELVAIYRDLRSLEGSSRVKQRYSPSVAGSDM